MLLKSIIGAAAAFLLAGSLPAQAPDTSSSPAPGQSAAPAESPAPTQSEAPSQSPAPDQSAAPAEVPAPSQSEAPSQSAAPGQSQAPKQSPAPSKAPAPSPAPAPIAAPIPIPPPAPKPEPENILLLDLSTGGRVAIQLRPDVAPNHVERIKTLTREHFYDGLTFHRVIDGFMAQTGDPQGSGEGGSKLPDLAAEFNGLPHLRGTVSAARTSEPNSANSQFFIMFGPRFSLDTHYTVFGRVISGMAYVDAIERGEPPANPSRILQASIAADNVPPPPPQPAAPAAPEVAAPLPGLTPTPVPQGTTLPQP